MTLDIDGIKAVALTWGLIGCGVALIAWQPWLLMWILVCIAVVGLFLVISCGIYESVVSEKRYRRHYH
jgi:hypothetical protein